MKELSREGIAQLGIEEMFAGKVWAYTPVVNDHGIGLGIAVANEPGYNPVPSFFCHGEIYDEVAQHADRLNHDRGLSLEEATRCIASTMRKRRAGQ